MGNETGGSWGRAGCQPSEKTVSAPESQGNRVDSPSGGQCASLASMRFPVYTYVCTHTPSLISQGPFAGSAPASVTHQTSRPKTSTHSYTEGREAGHPALLLPEVTQAAAGNTAAASFS